MRFEKLEDNVEVSQSRTDALKDAKKKDVKSRFYIYQSIDSPIIEKVVNAEIANQTWESWWNL